MADRLHAGKWGYFDDFDVDLPEKMTKYLLLTIENKEFSCAQT